MPPLLGQGEAPLPGPDGLTTPGSARQQPLDHGASWAASVARAVSAPRTCSSETQLRSPAPLRSKPEVAPLRRPHGPRRQMPHPSAWLCPHFLLTSPASSGPRWMGCQELPVSATSGMDRSRGRLFGAINQPSNESSRLLLCCFYKGTDVQWAWRLPGCIPGRGRTGQGCRDGPEQHGHRAGRAASQQAPQQHRRGTRGWTQHRAS